MIRRLLWPALAASLLVACSTASKPAITSQPTAASPAAAVAQLTATPPSASAVAGAATPNAAGTPAPGSSFPATGSSSAGPAATGSPLAAATSAIPPATTAPGGAPSGSAVAATQPPSPAIAASPTGAATPAPISPAVAAPTGKAAPTGSPPDSGLNAPTGTPDTSGGNQPISTAPTPAADITATLDQIKLVSADLPTGYGLGSLAAFEPNERATAGFENPDQVLALMNSTGRIGGDVQQVFTPDGGNGAGVSIEAWDSAEGAKVYFDQFPKPANVQYHEVTLPQVPGDQVFAYQYTAGAGSGISIAWRRGRFIIGVGEALGADQSLDNLMQLIQILDGKAQKAR
ncbi:MAG: hypothetical protein ACYDCQ_03160 [Dehalococcoidia bacterium]